MTPWIVVLVAMVVGVRVTRNPGPGPSLSSLLRDVQPWQPPIQMALLAATVLVTFLAPAPGLGPILVGHLAAMLLLVQLSRIPGIVMIAIGLGLNALVIALNGAMPVWQPAVEFLGGAGDLVLASPRHEAVTAATALAMLGDVIPVPLLDVIVSIGDLIMASGVVLTLEATVRAGIGTAPAPAQQLA